MPYGTRRDTAGHGSWLCGCVAVWLWLCGCVAVAVAVAVWLWLVARGSWLWWLARLLARLLFGVPDAI